MIFCKIITIKIYKNKMKMNNCNNNNKESNKYNNNKEKRKKLKNKICYFLMKKTQPIKKVKMINN